MAKVYNKHHEDAPPGAVYIGRGSPWGNPHRIGPGTTREAAIRNFELWVLPTMDVEPLRGKDLVCFCAPRSCHGDAIMRKLYGS